MSKINKLGKSTFVIAILSFLLVAVLAFGGTYAYFSANATAATGDVKLGHLTLNTTTIAGATEGTIIANAVPNQKVIDSTSNAVTVAVDSTIDFFVRAKVSYTVETKDHTCDQTCTDKNLKEVLILTVGDTWDEDATYTSAVDGERIFYLKKAQASGTESVSLGVDGTVNEYVGNIASKHFMDATITVSITFEAIQADFILGDDVDVDTTTEYTAEDLKDAWAAAAESIPSGQLKTQG